jgi:hypothetical protein
MDRDKAPPAKLTAFSKPFIRMELSANPHSSAKELPIYCFDSESNRN